MHNSHNAPASSKISQFDDSLIPRQVTSPTTRHPVFPAYMCKWYTCIHVSILHASRSRNASYNTTQMKRSMQQYTTHTNKLTSRRGGQSRQRQRRPGGSGRGVLTKDRPVTGLVIESWTGHNCLWVIHVENRDVVQIAPQRTRGLIVAESHGGHRTRQDERLRRTRTGMPVVLQPSGRSRRPQHASPLSRPR